MQVLAGLLVVGACLALLGACFGAVVWLAQRAGIIRK